MYIPVGTQVYDIELKPNKGSQLIKAAGTSGMIVQKDLQLKKIDPFALCHYSPAPCVRFAASCVSKTGDLREAGLSRSVL